MKLTDEQLDKLRRGCRLSPRETQVVALLFEGLATNDDIALRLGTTEGAVRAALRTMQLKTCTTAKHQLVLFLVDALQHPDPWALGDIRQRIYRQQNP